MLISPRNQQDSGELPEKFNPWSAYSDMYCSLLLIFMLLFFFVILNYLQLQDENAKATAYIQNELNVRLSQQEDMTEELNQAQAKIVSYETALSQWDSRYVALSSDYDRQALELDDARRSAQAQAAQIQSLEDALSLANQFLTDAQQRSAEQESAASAEKIKIMGQLADRDEQIDDLNGQLQRALSAAQDSEKQNTDLNRELERLRDELRTAENNVSSLTRQNAALDNSLNEAMAQMSAQQEELDALRADTTAQAQASRIAELESALESSGQEWQLRLSRMEEERDAAQAQAQSAQAALEEQRQNAASGSRTMSAQLSALQQEKSTLEKQLDAANLVQDEISSQLAESRRLTSYYSRQAREASEQLAEQRQRAQDAEALLAAAGEDSSRFAAQAEEQQARIAALEAEILALQSMPVGRVRTAREVAEMTDQIMKRLIAALNKAGVPFSLSVSGDAFIFDADELFSSGATDLNRAGRQRMDAFFPVFLQSLLNDPEADSIRAISFVAYEKDAGSYSGKMNLAVNRAANAVKYCYGQAEANGVLPAAKREWLQEVLSVGGHVIEKGEDSPADSDNFVEVAFTLWYNKE